MTTKYHSTAFSTVRLALSVVCFVASFIVFVSFETFIGVSSSAFGKDVGETVVAPSAETPKTSTRAFPGFRFWKVPEERIDSWPWGSKKYYPIRTDVFDEWLQSSSETTRRRGAASGFTFHGVTSSIVLDAKLEDDALEGTGVFTTSLSSSETETLKDYSPEALFPLRSFSFALAPVAEDEDWAIGQVGIYPDGRLYLPDSESKSRSFRWSQRGTSDASGVLVFDLELPVALYAELWLETPDDANVSVDNGVALIVEETSLESNASEPGVSDDRELDVLQWLNERPPVRKWRVFFNGRAHSRLTITRGVDMTTMEARRPWGYRQELSYAISRGGLETTSRFEFERSDSRCDELELRLDKPLSLRSLEWSSRSGEPLDYVLNKEDDGSYKIVVRTPERRNGDASDVLTVVAFCPIDLNAPPQLPSVRLATPSTSWRETLCRLAVNRPLVASTLSLNKAIQVRDSSRSRQEDQDLFAFKFFDCDSSISVQLRLIPSKPRFDSVTDCLVAANDVSAKTTILFDLRNADLREVRIPMAKDWKVESVLSLADEPIAWFLEGDVDVDVQTLCVTFKRASTPGQPTRVTLSSRRVKSFDEQTPVDELCPIVVDSLYGAHALTLRVESPYQIKLTTRAGRPYAAPETTPNFVFSEAQLREQSSSSGVRLYLGDQTIDAVASLENLQSNYTLDGSCFCELNSQDLTERWSLRCEPTSGSRVDRVVFFVPTPSERTRGSDAPWEWATSTEPERRFIATRLTGEEASALSPVQGFDAYEIRLLTSRSVPFDLVLTHSTPIARETIAPLLFFPEGTKSVEVVVSSSLGRLFETRAESLIETTTPTSPDDEYESLKKAFRYDPNLPLDPKNFKVAELVVLTSERYEDDFLQSTAWCWFENFDTFYESNGFVRNHVCFLIENRGLVDFEIYLPDGFARESVRSVWLGSQRVTWAFDDERNAIVTALPTNRRFVEVGVEFSGRIEQPGAYANLKPFDVVCCVPVLSGTWNAWASPQYRVFERSTASSFDERRSGSWTRAALDVIWNRGSKPAELLEVADRFVARFGDAAALRIATASANGVDLSSTDASKLEPPTWGDVFGSPTLMSQLFAPNYKEDEVSKKKTSKPRLDAPIAVDSADASNGKNEKVDPVDTPFGSLLPTSEPFKLYVDRFATAGAGITPSMPVKFPSADVDTATERSCRALEDAGLALLFLDSDFVLLTSNESLSRGNVRTIAMRGSSVKRCQRRSDARRIREEVLANSRNRFVAPSSWRKLDNSVSPWVERSQDEVLQGWTRVSLPLDRVDVTATIVDRHFLIALELFVFISFVTLFWRSENKTSTLRPRFFVGVSGLCLAAQFLVPTLYAAGLRGILYGAIGVLVVYVVTQRRAYATDDVLDYGNDDESDESSTQGFVDIKKLSPSERRFLQMEEDKENNDEFDASTLERDLERSGKATTTILATLAFFACLFVASSFAWSKSDDPRLTEPTAEQTTSDAVATSTAPSFSENDSIESPSDSTGVRSQDVWQEPYRVFAPVDKERRPVGEYYWIDSEFYEQIRTALKERPRERNWRVVDAFYEGAVSYNSLDDATSLFNLKATYKIVLDSTSATIALPALQLAADVGSKFDKQTIATTYDERGSEMLFEVEDVAPGEHVLELTLAPPQFSENSLQVSVPLLPVPSARLELSVPIDAPPLDVPNARGKITRSAGRLVAELGAVDRLTLAKRSTSNRLDKTTLDVEQLFLMRPRASQTEIRSLFRYQAVGGKIKTLEIECDPLYSFSGYCQCDEAEIENTEPPTLLNNVMRVTFKEPISGAFTLNVNFVARSFSGVGRVQFPQITTRNARVVRRWLALSPSAEVECTDYLKSTLATSAFQKSWGALDETLLAVYDLTALGGVTYVSTSLRTTLPNVSACTTYLFRLSQTEIVCDATLEASTELFRLTFDVPNPFVVDSITLTDAQGAAVETPDQYLTDDGLALVFSTPLRGQYKLRIVGRTKTNVDVQQEFPGFQLLGARYLRRFTRVFCESDVYLDWLPPKDWNETQLEELAGLTKETPEGDVYSVGFFEIGMLNKTEQNPSSSRVERVGDEREETIAPLPEIRIDANVPMQLEPSTLTAHVNSPKFVGKEQTFLLPGENGWSMLVDIKFDVQNGSVKRFCIKSDDSFSWTSIKPNEAFSWESLKVNDKFETSETTTSTGERAIAFDMKEPLDKSVEIQLVATLKNDLENFRLPQFQLLASSPREDLSELKRIVQLPLRQEERELNWTIHGLDRLLEEPKSNESAEAQRGKLTSAIQAMASGSELTVEKKTQQDDFPSAVVDMTGMNKSDFQRYSRDVDASVALETGQERLTVSRALHSVYFNGRNQFFGTSTFTFRPCSLTECVVVTPKGYNLLEAKVNGSRRIFKSIGEDRWLVEFDTTPYVKRLEISYGGMELRPVSLRRWHGLKRSESLELDLPYVDGSVSERVMWICAFDSFDSYGDLWNVRQYRRDTEGNVILDDSKFMAKTCQPIAFAKSGEALFRINVDVTTSLYEACETDLTACSGSRVDDWDRLRARWAQTLRQNETSLSQFAALNETYGVLTDEQRNALLVVKDDAPVDVSNDMAIPFARYRDMLELKKKVEERLGAGVLAEYSKVTASPQSLWTLGVGASTRLLFGYSDTNVARVVFVATPKSHELFRSSYLNVVIILLATSLVLNLLRRADPTPRRIRAPFFGTAILIWATFFFYLGFRGVGLVGVAFLAVGPPTISSICRRYSSRQEARAKRKKRSKREIATSDSDLDTTASMDPPGNGTTTVGTTATRIVGSESQYFDSKDKSSSIQEPFD